ncbi:MAG: DNA cytosine methyltransferase [Flavipsychrobacter sp.]|nr:DNA cytosine methyltransferase [Flavipsychrobacter sp.]
MRHGSLFSGGGGFDLAAEKMGWKNIFHCEKDMFCQTILQHYWPDAAAYEDIGDFDATPYKGKIDILTGGFPCQPFSAAGKRAGTADDRYLWPAMYRVIREVKPRWIVCENVYGLLNWNEGLVFDTVQSDLETEDYEVASYVLPASGVNAPHQRYRVWIVGRLSEPAAAGKAEAAADTDSLRRQRTGIFCKASQRRNARQHKQTDSLCPVQSPQAAPNSHCERQQPQTPDGKLAGRRPRFNDTGYRWQDWPTQPPLCGGNDGIPTRLDGITLPKWISRSISMFGNAIVPELALQLFKTIEQYECLHGKPFR